MPENPAQGRADVDDVVRLMVPELEASRHDGGTAMVECTPVGLGRRTDTVAVVSRAASVPVLVPTGIYREPWVPPWAHDANEGELAEWMIGELNDGIAGTGLRAAWVKVSAGDDGLTATEEKILRFAAPSGSHTVSGDVLLRQLDVIEEVGAPSPAEPTEVDRPNVSRAIHLDPYSCGAIPPPPPRRGELGCWVEDDAIGDLDDADFLKLIVAALDAGFRDRVLLG